MSDNINFDAANDRISQFAEFLDKFGGASVETFAALNKLKKGTEAYDKAQKQLWSDLTGSLKRFDKQIQNGTASLEDYKDHIEKLDDALAHVTDAAQREALQRDRDVIAEKARQKALSDGAAQFSKSLTSGAVQGTAKFTTSLQDGASATQVSSEIFSVAIDSASEAVKGIGGVVSALAGGAADRFLGKATGAAVRKAVNASAEMATAGLKFASAILAKEVEKTIKAYHDMSTAGAMFADGMTGMRAASAASGLTLAQFSNVVKNNTNQLASSGLGMSTAVRMMGDVGTTLRKSGLQNSLLKLGYSFEEQAELSAQVMADMRASQVGPLQASKEQIAKETAEYAENLRVISAVTGEDAKKKMDQVRQRSTELAFQQKLAGMDEIQRKNVLAGMALMPEALQKNYMDLVVFGHVVNKEGAAMAALSPNMRRAGEEAYNLTMQNQYNLKQQEEIGKRYYSGIQKDALGMTQIGLAGAAKTGGMGQQLAEAFGGMLQELKKATPEAIAEAQDMASKQKVASDKLTEGVTNAATASQQLANDLESILTPAVGDYANATAYLLEVIEDAMRAAGLEVGPRAGQYTGPTKYNPSKPQVPYASEVPTFNDTDRQRMIDFDKKYIAESQLKADSIRKKLAENAKLNPLAPEALSQSQVKKLNEELTKLTEGIKTSQQSIKTNISRMESTPAAPGKIKLANITTKSGVTFQVAENEKEKWQGFIDELEATGYKIRDVKGQKDRTVKAYNPATGKYDIDTGRPSHHSTGTAIDINPATNPNLRDRLVTDMPANIADIAHRHGMRWGGSDFGSQKDSMHFDTQLNSKALGDSHALLQKETNEKLDKLIAATTEGNRDRKQIDRKNS